MVCMIVGWRVAKAEFEAHTKELNAGPARALEMVPPEVSGLAAAEAAEAGTAGAAAAAAGAGASSAGAASVGSRRRPTRLSGSTTSTFASDLP